MSPSREKFIKGLKIHASKIGDWRSTFGDEPELAIAQKLEELKNHPEVCFSLIDLRNMSMLSSYGTNRLFGISEADFSMAQFIELIHPSFRWVYYAKALAALEGIDQFKAFVNLNTPYAYNVFLNLRLKDGIYYRVRQHSIPYGLDEDGNMALQLNFYYTGLEPYNGQSITSFFSYSGTEFRNHFTQAMEQAHQQALHEQIFKKIPELSPKYKKGWNLKDNELNFLRYYRDHPDAKRKDVAMALGYKVHYCNELWGKIKDKVHALFAPAYFGTPVDVARFFDQMDILPKHPKI